MSGALRIGEVLHCRVGRRSRGSTKRGFGDDCALSLSLSVFAGDKTRRDEKYVGVSGIYVGYDVFDVFVVFGVSTESPSIFLLAAFLLYYSVLFCTVRRMEWTCIGIDWNWLAG